MEEIKDKLLAPTIAASQRPSFIALYAASRAYMLDEQAESITKLGPEKWCKSLRNNINMITTYTVNYYVYEKN